MSLFGYYAWHSVKNQIKKLFKSWVLIFIVVCMLIGGLVGGIIGSIEEKAEENEPQIPIEEVIPGMEDGDSELPEEIDRELLASIVEAVAGVVIFGMLLLLVKSADKNGSSMFLPADVTLLFTSPMKPQAVLAFRVMCTIGLVLFTSIYMLFQLPNLILNVGLSWTEAISILIAWVFVILFGQLIRIFLYTLCTTKEHLKKYITPGIIAIILLALAGFIAFYLLGDEKPSSAILSYINGSISRYIPIWGWTKGIVGCALENNIKGMVIYSALDILAAIAIVFGTWQIKADFYEDAMTKSEELAEIQRDMQSGRTFTKRKKDRSEKLLRDGFKKGWGANVYFYKSMYNRRRFGTLGYFTKTTFLYLAVGLSISLLFNTVILEGNGLNVAAMILGVMIFYRSLGNPLEEDTKSQYFVLVPEPVGKKIFYSLLGSTVNCVLDFLPAMLMVCIATGGTIPDLLAWTLFLASIDLYATIVGTFIGLSTPASAGLSLKQMIQILFLYFGLLPDIGLIGAGLYLEELMPFALLAMAINLVLSAIFFALATNFISPRSRKVEGVSLSYEELKNSKRTFSRACFVPLVMAVVAVVIQGGLMIFLEETGTNYEISNAFIMLLNFLPMYCIGFPLGYLVVRKLPSSNIEKHDLKIKDFLKILPVCIFFMYAGNIIGTLITSFFASSTGTESTNVLNELLSDMDMIWIVIFVVIIGPIVEELIFRKLFIDKTEKYGAGLSIACSAIAFGLFHGNLNQFFYATALGLVFGYVYVKTGKIRYTIALHMIVNFIGSVVSLLIVKDLDLDALDNAMMGQGTFEVTTPIIMFGVYALCILVIGIAGLIIFLANIKKISLPSSELPLMKGQRFKTAYLNAGFICILLYFVISTLSTFVSTEGFI